MFVSTKTTIPIPKLIGYGLTGNTHHLNGLPFLILTHVPGKPLGGVWGEWMKPQVKIYDQMADITLQLRSHPFDRIGSLTVDDRGQWSLSNRPLGRPLASLQRDGIDIRMAQSFIFVRLLYRLLPPSSPEIYGTTKQRFRSFRCEGEICGTVTIRIIDTHLRQSRV